MTPHDLPVTNSLPFGPWPPQLHPALDLFIFFSLVQPGPNYKPTKPNLFTQLTQPSSNFGLMGASFVQPGNFLLKAHYCFCSIGLKDEFLLCFHAYFVVNVVHLFVFSVYFILFRFQGQVFLGRISCSRVKVNWSILVKSLLN